jgi:hypothetical protein
MWNDVEMRVGMPAGIAPELHPVVTVDEAR